MAQTKADTPIVSVPAGNGPVFKISELQKLRARRHGPAKNRLAEALRRSILTYNKNLFRRLALAPGDENVQTVVDNYIDDVTDNVAQELANGRGLEETVAETLRENITEEENISWEPQAVAETAKEVAEVVDPATIAETIAEERAQEQTQEEEQVPAQGQAEGEKENIPPLIFRGYTPPTSQRQEARTAAPKEAPIHYTPGVGTGAGEKKLTKAREEIKSLRERYEKEEPSLLQSPGRSLGRIAGRFGIQLGRRGQVVSPEPEEGFLPGVPMAPVSAAAAGKEAGRPGTLPAKMPDIQPAQTETAREKTAAKVAKIQARREAMLRPETQEALGEPEGIYGAVPGERPRTAQEFIRQTHRESPEEIRIRAPGPAGWLSSIKDRIFTSLGLGKKKTAEKVAGTVTAAAKIAAGKEALAGTGKILISAAAKKFAGTALGTILGGPVGAALAWGITLVADRLWPEIKKLLKVLGGAAGAAFMMLMTLLAKAGLAGWVAGGALTGALIGSFIPGVGTIGGFIIGGFVGGVAGYISQMVAATSAAGAGAGGVAATAATAISGTVPSLMGIATGLGGTGLLGTAAVSITTGLSATFLTATMLLGLRDAVYQDPVYNAQVGADIAAPVGVYVKKVGSPDTVANDQIGKTEIAYLADVVQARQIKSATVKDEIIINKKGTPGTPIVIFGPQPYQQGKMYDYKMPLTPQMQDSLVINKFTIEGTMVNSVGKEEQFTASASFPIKVGTPSMEVFSCPVISGRLCEHSLSNGSPAHCDTNYRSNPELDRICPGGTNYWQGNETAIDVCSTQGAPVYLPSIDGQAVNWHYEHDGNDNNYPGQKYRQFSATVNGVPYVLQLHHMINEQVTASTLASGTVVGHLAAFPGGNTPHSHIQIKRNGTFISAEEVFKGCL